MSEDRLAGIKRVRAAHRELRYPGELTSAREAVIEIMIAERHELVAQRIHETDHRFAAGRVGDKIVAEGVAGIDKQHVARSFAAADLVHLAGEIRKSADVCGPLESARTPARIAGLRGRITGCHMEGRVTPMYVVGMQNRDRLRLGHGRHRQSNGKSRQHETHHPLLNFFHTPGNQPQLKSGLRFCLDHAKNDERPSS